ncbi:MAG: phosphate-starvation-inducible PsiE family protein [Pseudomonadota bacterium]|uniref:phosphate-starvation-inducible PsiE family protein n=1 Tax=Thermithiobacillus tepidarius TaxID=929 RepID=UPI0003FAB5DC|nr:phosphate-starvation-inducible PsiE family protein [Thermithiobacillus tepidarius]
MLAYLKKFERVVVLTLIAMLSIVVLLAVGELGWVLVQDAITPPVLILEIDELLDIFGLFLLVLIGIELLEMMKAYLAEGVVHSEVVLTVALIAIARKIVVLDARDYSGATLVGIGVIIVALAAAYWVIRRARG